MNVDVIYQIIFVEQNLGHDQFYSDYFAFAISECEDAIKRVLGILFLAVQLPVLIHQFAFLGHELTRFY